MCANGGGGNGKGIDKPGCDIANKLKIEIHVLSGIVKLYKVVILLNVNE